MTANSNYQLERLRSLPQALERLPEGRQALELAARLGLWTAAHEQPGDRRATVDSFSDLSHDELSDEHAYWLSELHRLTECVGMLRSVRKTLALQIKQVRAGAATRVRRQRREEGLPKPSQQEVSDEVELDEEVARVEEAMALLDMLSAQAEAAKEASDTTRAGISREYTLRGDLLQARVLGP